MVTPTRKEREKARHQQEILRAAERVFSEKGFHGATTEEIARQAEFAVGTLYKFFASKEDIYWAVLQDGMNQRLEFVREVFSDPQVDPVQAIETFIEAKARFFMEHGPFYRLFLKEHLGGSPILPQERRDQIWAIYEESLTVIEAAIQRGIDQGRIRPMPPRDLALGLEGITSIFLHTALLHQNCQDYQSKIPVMKALFLRGALVESETKSV